MKSHALILGLAALFASPAAAQQRAPVPAPVRPAPGQAPAPGIPTRLTARGLTTICNENSGACLTYVLGAVDAFVATTVVNYGRTDLCFAQATNMQIATVAIAYVRAHPEAQDRNAAMVVLQGLRANFPCR